MARAVKRAQKKAVKVYADAKRKAMRKTSAAAKQTRKGINGLMKSIKTFRKKHKDRDKGFRKRLKEIQKLARLQLRIGVLSAGEAEHKDSPGLTVREVGTFHEFGLGVPRRSFIRDWYDPNVGRIKSRATRVSELVVSGKSTTERAAALLGVWAQGEIQKRMSEGIGPPLAATTIKRKGSSKQLIDTGQLRSSITFEVKL
jgi:hypothetical protein